MIPKTDYGQGARGAAREFYDDKIQGSRAIMHAARVTREAARGAMRPVFSSRL
jgi:hypothetical protein